jgi:hypothetical protein
MFHPGACIESSCMYLVPSLERGNEKKNRFYMRLGETFGLKRLHAIFSVKLVINQ